MKNMNYANLKQVVELFLGYMAEVPSAQRQAKDRELYYNNVTIDVCHAAELNPEYLSDIDLVKLLRNNQIERRAIKETRRILDCFATWCKKNEKAMQELQTALDESNKVDNESDTNTYHWKTNAVGNIGAQLVRSNLYPNKLSIMSNNYIVNEGTANVNITIEK